MHTNFTAEHPPDGPVVEMTNASFTERHGYDAYLEGVTLRIEQGELVMILLEQGCVEYPLADVLSGLQTCSEGEVRVFGQSIAALGPDTQGQARWRIGRVFSGHGWMSNLDVDENVTLAERHHSDRSPKEIEEEALRLAKMVGLEKVPHERPSIVDPAPLRKAEWVRAAIGSPWLMILEQPGRHMPAGWIDNLHPLVNHVRKSGTAVIWICEDKEEWDSEKLNPSLKLRAIGNKLTGEGRS